MNYALLVLASPASGLSNLSALRFAEAALARGHKIHRVFFLDQGTSSGLATSVYPQGEADPVALWAELGERHNLDLVLCISSALKRGLLDASEAARYERQAQTLHPAFSLGGLGLLVEATAEVDRLLTFGGPS
ncbi:sulfurtransferase complex subunit TusD [Parahaliea sp. F7430]|uniref:Sulfurtransferase complex subunit TusD n=1 Tax=Sediminihaliea albiluteola TaxID=2758564 RepID=A0A7W2TUJ5_9GAMM|nr:sulfurtransferase complex subunit TusD [Sediminihaliea albiluteola]MBA6412169.1 sulfurtransferase complex subunit TusD [Sediminihaliea albiluteola]